MAFRRSGVRIPSGPPPRRVLEGLAFFVVPGSFMRNSAHTLYLLDAQEHLLHRAHVGTVAPYTCPRGRDQGHISQISHRRYAHHMTAGDTLRYLPTTWTHAMPLRPALRQRVYPSVAFGRHVRLAPLAFISLAMHIEASAISAKHPAFLSRLLGAYWLVEGQEPTGQYRWAWVLASSSRLWSPWACRTRGTWHTIS